MKTHLIVLPFLVEVAFGQNQNQSQTRPKPVAPPPSTGKSIWSTLLPLSLQLMGGDEMFRGDDPLGPVRDRIGSTMGMSTQLAGLFGLGLGSLDMVDTFCTAFAGNNFLANSIGSLFGNPNGPGPDETCTNDQSGGSGPYKSKYSQVDSLVNHTIYAPATPIQEKLPVLVWSNGFCLQMGLMFNNFHREIASHGFMVISNGAIKGDLSNVDSYKDLINAIEWVTSSPDVKKYGNINTDRIAVGGQSCGGLQALAASKDPRVKLVTVFNSGLLGGSKEKMADFSKPVAYFLGGESDVGFSLGQMDYTNTEKAPAMVADINTGHIGSYYQKSGGRSGKAATEFFKWRFKDDLESKKLFCESSTNPGLTDWGWTFKTKNGMCS